MFAKNFVGRVEGISIREAILPSARTATWNADLRTASNTTKSKRSW